MMTSEIVERAMKSGGRRTESRMSFDCCPAVLAATGVEAKDRVEILSAEIRIEESIVYEKRCELLHRAGTHKTLSYP